MMLLHPCTGKDQGAHRQAEAGRGQGRVRGQVCSEAAEGIHHKYKYHSIK